MKPLLNGGLRKVRCKTLRPQSVDRLLSPVAIFFTRISIGHLLGLPVRFDGQHGAHMRDPVGIDLADNPILVADHCYGCTAGQGTSCRGAL